MQGSDVTGLLRTAGQLLQAGRGAEAIAAFQQALEVRQDLPDAWFNLAYLQRNARLFEDALHSYRRALDHGAARPEEIHLNRAAILSEQLFDGPAAEAELRAALALNPRFLAGWLNLGNLYEDWGNVARAREAYESALAVAPANGRALARLTMIDIFEGRGDSRLEILSAALQRPNLPLEEAAEIGFAAGHALDAVADYDRAFQYFTFANRAAHQQLAGRMRYDPVRHERVIDALIDWTPPHLDSPATEGTPPIFICGMFRSGSTLVEHILGRHSQVTAGGEFDVLPALVKEHVQPYPDGLQTLPRPVLGQMRDTYLATIRSLHPDADRITDKRPDNFLHIGLIKSMFPSARIVHTRRNPLDNILSIYFLYFGDAVPYGFSLDDIAHWFGQYFRLMDHWKRLYPGDIHDVDYDELVTAPEPVTQGLLDFCGLPAEALTGRTPGADTADWVRTPSAWQVRKPLHRRSSGRWQNYAAHLEGVRDRLGLD